MKRILLYLFLFLGAGTLSAQTFVVPDSNFFVAILQTQPTCSTCVVDYTTREIDIACIDGKNIISLNVTNKNIGNLQGIQYFADLITLNCLNNPLTSLSNSLPNSLITLNCYNTQLTSLPNPLPNNLTTLNCFNSQLTSLPNPLPNSLNLLYCYNNPLTSLPNPLPNSLSNLNCDNNQLTSLPNPLPNSLTSLSCMNNQLTSLPNPLPNSLSSLQCSYNQLTSLPNPLPSSLSSLQCNYNNQLASLPNPLPNNLNTLGCGFTQVTILPSPLPNSLAILYCFYTQLTSLPNPLPNSLTQLYCYNSQLTSLPNPLPNGLTTLHCHNNQLTSLPNPLSNSLTNIDCHNNPIFCSPNLRPNLSTYNTSNTFITCLPNYNAYITSANSGLPLCDSILTSQCTPLNTAGMSEYFPLTEIRKIVHDTLYLPFTTPPIDIVDYEIAIYNKNPIQKDTLVIFGGDIVLGKPQQLNTLYGFSSPITAWQGKIPYNPVGISDSIHKSIQYFNVRAALMGLHIAFVPKELTDVDYVTFVHSPGTYASYVGKIGGEQYVWVDTAGYTGKILHEMTHVLGMYHEHQRDSAQFYVNLQSQYIRTAFADAFCRIKDIQLTPYDYNSLMHYVCYAFSSLLPVDGVNLFSHQNTLLPTQVMNDAEMGQRSDYTNYDIADINQIYPDGIVGGVGPLGTGIYTLLLPTYLGQSYTVSWSIYNTEPLVYMGNTYNIAIQSTTIIGGLHKATLSAPQPITAPRAARGFIVATVTFTNGTIKKFYKYVYRN